MRNWRYGGLMMFLVLLCGQAPVNADGESILQRVRLSVAQYDLGPDGIIQVLGEMGSTLSAGVEDDNVRREMQFLHGAVSADMLFLASYRADDNLRARMAEIWGADPAHTKAAIVTSLQSADGIYKEPAERIVRRLALIDDSGAIRWDALSAATGSWRDIALIRDVAKGIQNGQSDVVLRRFGKDPCAGIKGGCAGLFMTYDAQSRLMMAGLREVGQARSRLRKADTQGDPLAAALSEEIEADYATARGVELRLVPMLRSGTRVESEKVRPSRVPVDLLVHLHVDHVEYGYVPRVRLTAAGELEPVIDREPALPQMAQVEYPKTFRPYMRPLSELVDSLVSNGGGAPDISVGVSAEPGIESHILGRVFLALRRAGYEQSAIISRGTEGLALGIPLRVLDGEEADQLRPAPEVQIRVRLGGYSLKIGNGLTNDIPRIRYEDQGYRFDTETLYARLRDRKIRSAAISFMSNVAVENLMAAMWRVAPEQDALNLVVP